MRFHLLYGSLWFSLDVDWRVLIRSRDASHLDFLALSAAGVLAAVEGPPARIMRPVLGCIEANRRLIMKRLLRSV